MNTGERQSGKRRVVFVSIIWVLLGAFFLITLVSQIYLLVSNPYQTEIAMLYTTSDSVTFKGVHIRNERLVQYSGADVISYIHPDGSKIGSNSVVAKSYKTKADILLQRQIDELTEQTVLLKAAEILINTDNSQLESYSNQITNRHNQLLLQVNNEDYSSVNRHKNEYLSLMSKKHILKGDEYNYAEQISRLESQITSLKNRMSAQPRDVIIEEAGYFVSMVDGYENRLDYDMIYSLSKADIENIIKEPELEVSSSIIGKMVDGYKWRFVGFLDSERTRNIYEGLVVDFRIGGNTQIVQAIVLNKIPLEDGTAIFVFECDTLTAEFASKRVSQFNLLLNSNSGIRIPSAAIHFVNGENGVYVQKGAELVFRRIKELIHEKDYYLVENTTDIPDYISLYDTIVVRGKDLYEGKIVQ